MKKILLSVFGTIMFFCAILTTQAQSLKVGVFDIDLMVQSMPGYRSVDSLLQIYEADSLGVEYQYYQNEYHRLDSTYKADSVLVAQGKKLQALLDFTITERRKMAMNIVYWQQLSQNKMNTKRSQLSQPLFQVVTAAYRKVLARKKYTLILKPQTYEAGFAIDNIFIAIARELKLDSLPQELLYLGDDPDPAKPAAKQPVKK